MSDDGAEAGLTSKPHRDQRALDESAPYVGRFACDWHRLAVQDAPDDATTDPNGLHAQTLAPFSQRRKATA
ncbi:hypothetical protein GCM10007231_29180 [Nocardioides daphniae]|uniref:Uncharacterized protein n=1 Tax=Nocardioides daphniae TaxID=402297 RepID=A0ABQ1QHE6_9ACTN|nr:hypothetical protein GCM10007231_29180 [Nocardioides daphniae]